MRPIPILFISDSPETQTGLARIGRDLATIISRQPQFRVGYLGLRGNGSRQLPFPVYQIKEPQGIWGEADLAYVWQDFAGADEGIIFTIWDISRVGYIGTPEILDHPLHQATRQLCERRPFKWWGYFPVDATSIGDRFHGRFIHLYNRCDRRLFYSKWAHELAGRSRSDGEWIPHGFDLHKWTIQDRQKLRKEELPNIIGQIPDHSILVGCVGTNQGRKDWGLTFATIAKLNEMLKGDVHFWAHIDTMFREWNLAALADGFGLRNKVSITTSMPDSQLAKMYAACDVTIANGLGEGFGYPIIESLSCGTPAVHGNYGGGAELIQNKDWLVEPTTYRLEGEYNLVRPVFQSATFAEKCLLALGANRERCREMVEHLDWSKLWPSVWKKWFLAGLK